MIDLQHALSTVKAYVREVYWDQPLQDFRIEEVQKSEDGRFWLVTVGFRAFSAELPDMRSRMTIPRDLYASPEESLIRFPRDYKVVRVDADTGQAVSMTNRAA